MGGNILIDSFTLTIKVKPIECGFPTREIINSSKGVMTTCLSLWLDVGGGRGNPKTFALVTWCQGMEKSEIYCNRQHSFNSSEIKDAENTATCVSVACLEERS